MRCNLNQWASTHVENLLKRNIWHSTAAVRRQCPSIDYKNQVVYFLSTQPNKPQSMRTGPGALPTAEQHRIIHIYVDINLYKYQVYIRALISGPASVEGCGREAGGEKNAICARIYTRKPSHRVRLNAPETSKGRVSRCLGMSWRRNELFKYSWNRANIV